MGIDIDQTMVKASIGNLHRMVNQEEFKGIVKKQQDAGQDHAGGDVGMLTSEESEKEKAIIKLMQRISQLPKSYQDNLSAESQFLSQSKASKPSNITSTSNPNQTADPLQPIDTEALRTKVQFKTLNYIENVSTPAV